MNVYTTRKRARFYITVDVARFGNESTRIALYNPATEGALVKVEVSHVGIEKLAETVRTLHGMWQRMYSRPIDVETDSSALGLGLKDALTTPTVTIEIDGLPSELTHKFLHSDCPLTVQVVQGKCKPLA